MCSQMDFRKNDFEFFFEKFQAKNIFLKLKSLVFNHILWKYRPKFGHFLSTFSPTQGGMLLWHMILKQKYFYGCCK